MPIRALLLASVAAFLAQEPTTLRWTPKEGDEVKIRTEAAINVAGLEATFSSLNTHKVIRVDPDGGFLVQLTASDAKVTMGGQVMPGGGMTTLTTYGPGGEIKEIRSDKLDASGYRMANLTNFHSPTKSVAVGDSWTSEGKSDSKTGAPAWKADYKVVGEETLKSYPALKMEVSARETEGTEAGKATGTIWVGKDGILVRSELTWTNIAVPGAPGPVNGKFTQMREP